MERQRARLTIIIPAYNETNRIAKTIQRQLQASSTTTAIFVCDDGSSDNTYTVCARAETESRGRVRVIRQEHSGRGQALRLVVNELMSGFVVFSSADLILREAELDKALNNLRIADIVMFSKVTGPTSGPSFRRILSLAFSLLVRIIFDVPFTDTQGVKVMRVSTAKQIMKLCRTNGFFLDAEFAIIGHKLGLRIVELPWTYSYSPGGSVNAKSIAIMIVEMLYTKLRLKRGQP